MVAIAFLTVVFCPVFFCGPANADTILTLAKTIEATAEQEIVKEHGSSGLLNLLSRLDQEFGFSSLPDPLPGDSCPALGFLSESTDAVHQLDFLNKSGADYFLGVEALLSGHLEIAKWGFARATVQNSNCPTYLSNLAFVLNEDADFPSAVLLLERARQLDPSDSSIYVNLAYGYQNLQRYDDAVGAMLVAVALEPEIKEYQVMLAELKKLQKDNPKELQGSEQLKKLPASAAAPQSLPMEQSLDDALALLQDSKLQDQQKEPALLPPSPPVGGGANRATGKNSALAFQKNIAGLQIAGLEENGMSACGYFRKQGSLLVSVGDEFAAKSGFATGGDALTKFREAGLSVVKNSKLARKKADAGEYRSINEQVKDVAALETLGTAMIFYGYAVEIRELCGELEAWPEGAKLLEQVRKEREQWKKDYFDNINKETFSRPVCRGSICISKGSQGTYQIEVGGSTWELEFKLHPTNLNRCGLKASLGPELLNKSKLGGLINVKLPLRTYYEWKVGQKMTSGTEISAEGEIGKYITTKGKQTYSIGKISPENKPGSPKKP